MQDLGKFAVMRITSAESLAGWESGRLLRIRITLH